MTEEKLTPEEMGKKLGLPKTDIKRALSKPSNALNYIKRRIRYYCFQKQRGEWAPTRLVHHFEKEKEFRGWDEFAISWDVIKANPVKARWRKFSIYEEWEAELRRVVPDAPLKQSYKQSK
jgi:hypothetical protein